MLARCKLLLPLLLLRPPTLLLVLQRHPIARPPSPLLHPMIHHAHQLGRHRCPRSRIAPRWRAVQQALSLREFGVAET